jgi:hypothetical protein
MRTDRSAAKSVIDLTPTFGAKTKEVGYFFPIIFGAVLYIL